MAVWWVYQNKSYPRSREGGYLWAPSIGKDGRRQVHWDAMDLVEPGDLILSCVNRNLVATSIAKSSAYPSPRPGPEDESLWSSEGRRVDVAYADLPSPFAVEKLQDLFPLLQKANGPIATDGRGKQGYLWPVSPVAAKMILERIGQHVDVDQILLSAIETDSPGPVTTSVRSQRVRVGQQKFREGVMALWGGACALSGVRDHRLLIASHIKSWVLANDRERLDPHNGLLLEAGFDRLFDSGLVTFDDSGLMLVSDELADIDRRALGLNGEMKLRQVPKGSAVYLDFHRKSIFLA